MQEYLMHTWEDLIGRGSGPLHFRLILQPIVAVVLAMGAGRKDARQGRPPILWTIVRRPKEWQHILREAWRGIGRLFLVGVALDLVYQLIAFHEIRLGQAFLVAFVLAVLPYLLVRSLTNRIVRWRSSKAPRQNPSFPQKPAPTLLPDPGE